MQRDPTVIDGSSTDSGGTALVFAQNFSLEDAIGSHACSLEARVCV
jgi:hypothetical protein